VHAAQIAAGNNPNQTRASQATSQAWALDEARSQAAHAQNEAVVAVVTFHSIVDLLLPVATNEAN